MTSHDDDSSDSTGDTGSGDNCGDERIAMAEKMRRVMQLRRQRMTFQKIGDELGHSRQHIHRLYTRALAEIPAADVHAYRIEMLDQLDELEAAALEVMHAHHVTVSNGHIVSEVIGHDDDGKPIYGDALADHGPVLDAIRTLVSVQARKARLLGADAPTQVETNSTITSYSVDLGGDAAREALT